MTFNRNNIIIVAVTAIYLAIASALAFNMVGNGYPLIEAIIAGFFIPVGVAFVAAVAVSWAVILYVLCFAE